MNKIEKQCVTCGGSGHTYLECNKLNFFDLFLATAGCPSLETGESAVELRERVIGEIDAINSESVGDA